MSTQPKTAKKWILIVGGTALTVIVAGVLFQVMRPEAGKAGSSRDGRSGRQKSAGTVRVGDKRKKKPVCRVNGQLISYEQLADECVARYGTTVLEGIINRTMIEQAFEGKPGAPTGEDVEAEIRKIAKKFHLDKEQWLQMMQTQQEMTPDQYRRDVIWPMLALKELAGKNVRITDKELKKAFHRNYGVRVKAKVIVLDRLREAQKVWEKAKKNPDDFGRLAMEHSVDPSSRALEGAVPPIRQYTGNDEVERAAFRLNEGEISAVIQIPENKHYVIIKCEGRTQPLEVDIADVREQLMQELREEKERLLVETTFKKIQDAARVDNYLTRVSHGSGNRPAANSRSGSPVRQVSGERSVKPPQRRRQQQ